MKRRKTYRISYPELRFSDSPERGYMFAIDPPHPTLRPVNGGLGYRSLNGALVTRDNYANSLRGDGHIVIIEGEPTRPA